MPRCIVPAVALAMGLLAGAVLAEPAAAPSTHPAAAGKTVEGLTVVAPPIKACSPRDKACIQMVAAELQRLYPEQLKRFCLQRDARARRTEISNDWLLEDLHNGGPPTSTTFGVNPALKAACERARK